jgi:hypothetical protein
MVVYFLRASEFYIELFKSLILEGQPSQAGILLKLREGGRVSNLKYDYILLCTHTYIHTYMSCAHTCIIHRYSISG